MDSTLLLSELESLAKQNSIPLPSTSQLFNIGILLHRLLANENPESPTPTVLAYQNLVKEIPETRWKWMLSRFQRALSTLAQSTATPTDALVQASEAMHGLLSTSPKLCELAFNKDWVISLAATYDRLILSEATVQQREVVLSVLSSLLLDGLFARQPKNVEEILLDVIQVMEEKSTDCLGHLQDWQARSEPTKRTLDSVLRSLPMVEDEDDRQQQREYLLNMLESSRQPETESNVVQSQPDSQRTHEARKPVAATDELERRIQQVKQILPHLGEGFLEAALSYYKGDVETTVSSLLMDPSEYPTALRVIDLSLPRRRKLRADDENQEAVQARQIVKERVALEQKQEESKYKALMYVQNQEERQRRLEEQQQGLSKDMYDDDYDDQYDDLDIMLGGADDGWADMEQIKIYNQTMRGGEAEDSFWEQNRNTNRQPQEAKAKPPAEEKQFRGPDKIKGGRVIGSDGKVVKNPGGSRGKKGKGNPPPQQSTQAKPNSGPDQNAKPRTKPKSQNKVGRQRDKKQKAQGTFGASG